MTSLHQVNLRRWRELLRDNDTLSASTKLVGFILSTYAESDNGYASPGNEVIGSHMGIGKRHVSTKITELTRFGFLVTEHVGHSAGPNAIGCGFNAIRRLVIPEGQPRA